MKNVMPILSYSNLIFPEVLRKSTSNSQYSLTFAKYAYHLKTRRFGTTLTRSEW